MKVSLYGLNEFIDVKSFFNRPQDLAHTLSMAGLEAEEWEDYSKKFPNIFVGCVLEKKKHPSSSRLQLAQVEGPKGKVFNIVCGADNFQTGDKTALALSFEGETSSQNPPPLIAIKNRTIRGEPSQGMMLSFAELFPAMKASLKNPDWEKDIIILPSSFQTGALLAPLIELNDIIFKLNITPNRADCLSHFGLARELACLLKTKLKTWPKPSLASAKPAPPQAQPHAVLEVKKPDLCPRYTGGIITSVRIQPSPLPLQIRLVYLGVKPINNIVDATNHIMLKWGQPLHAFDLDRLLKTPEHKAVKIIVDLSQKGEKFKTLDEETRELTGQELCIRTQQGPIALAGVMGGFESRIQPDTKNIFVESACFNAAIVRQTSSKWGLETESAYRFSRGIPPGQAKSALAHALGLMRDLSGGQLSCSQYDFWTLKPKPSPIAISKNNIERRLGGAVDFKNFQSVLKSLGCDIKVISSDKSSVKITPPVWRADLNIKEDLIEEYARVRGYEHIPECLTAFSSPPRPHAPKYVQNTLLAQVLTGAGFYEAINHSFTSYDFSGAFLAPQSALSAASPPSSSEQLLPKDPSYKKHFVGLNTPPLQPVLIQNPLSAEYNMMRVSLLPSLFKNAARSIHRGWLNGKLFELGHVYGMQNKKHLKAGGKASPYAELLRLGLIAWGQDDHLWSAKKGLSQTPHLFCSCVYSLKGAMEAGLSRFNITFPWEGKGEEAASSRTAAWEQSDQAPDFIHPGQFAVLKINNAVVGYVGSVHPAVLEKHKIRVDAAVAEWDISSLPLLASKTFKSFSRFPQIERDLAFWLPHNVPAGRLMEDLKKHAGPLCQSVKIFDVYQDKTKKRSVAFRLSWQAADKTLTDQDIEDLQSRAAKTVLSKWPSAQLRQF